jgi:hypothetical protein
MTIPAYIVIHLPGIGRWTSLATRGLIGDNGGDK